MIRLATIDDVVLIYAFIQKKAEFDRNIGAFSGELRVSQEKIRRTLFNTIPFAYALFAETAESEVGFALYAFRYSSFVGQPSIWLDDLYVNPDMRSRGAGSALMQHLAEIAKNNNCTHLAWNADARNTDGLRFYHRLDAKIIKREKHRCFFHWIPTIA